MDIQVPSKDFGGRQLTVRPATFFKSAYLMMDSEKAPAGPKKGLFKRTYLLRNNAGKDIVATLQHRILDPIPNVVLGEEIIELARPLLWYEYLWMAFPILLFFTGGALGALVGGGTAHFNSQIFRSDRSTFQKYLLTGLVSFGTTFLFLIVIGTLQLMLHPENK